MERALLSEARKKHISEAARGRKQTPEHIEKRMAHRRGKPLPAWWVEKLRKGHVGARLTASHKRNISKALAGRKLSPEHAQKLREAALDRYAHGWAPAKGKKRSPECREAMSQRMSGRKLSDETKHKLSIANLGKKMREDVRLRMIEYKRTHAQIGPANHRWRGGSDDWYHDMARRIWKNHHGCDIPPGYLIHHRDGNHKNNNIENLEMMTYQQHTDHHLRLRGGRRSK